VRSLLSGICFVVFGVGSLVVGFGLFPPLIWLGMPRAKRTLVRFSWWVFLGSMKVLRLVRIEISAADRARLAAVKGQVIVANHPTLIDIVILATLLPNATGIAKAAAGRNWFYSLIVKGMFLINDDPERVLVEAGELLAKGVNLVVFPEGTRTPVEAPEHRLHRGAAQIAMRTGAPMLPVRIVCTPPVLAKGQPWYDVAERTVEWRITVGDEIPVAAFPTGGATRANAVALTDQIRQSLFG